jgi:acyl carrier protein
MLSDDISARVEAFIRQRFHVPADDKWFSRRSNLWEEGYVDSTGVVELIAHLESTFDLALADEVLFDPAFSTIDGIAGILRTSMARRDRCSHDSATTTPGMDPV